MPDHDHGEIFVDQSQPEYRFFGTENRSLLLADDITTESAKELCDLLMAADDDDSEEPITLFINSGGGDVYATIMIIDTIRALATPVVGIVTGTAGSGAFFILQACDFRMMSQHSFLFWHNMISTGWEIKTPQEATKANEYYEKLNNKLQLFFKTRAKVSASNWKKFFQTDNDLLFDADEALSLKLIDKIVMPFKSVKVSKNVKVAKD